MRHYLGVMHGGQHRAHHDTDTSNISPIVPSAWPQAKASTSAAANESSRTAAHVTQGRDVVEPPRGIQPMQLMMDASESWRWFPWRRCRARYPL